MDFSLEQKTTIATIIDKKGLPDSMLGQKKIFTFTGEKKTGNLQLPWLEEQLVELVRRNSSNGKFKVASLFNPDKSDQNATVMIDPYMPLNELIILGGGHIALPLVSMGRLLGYQVTVVDDRPEFVSSERLSEANRRICCSFDDIEDRLTLGPGSSVIIVTRGHKHDLECLRKVIKYPLAFLGMIGSRRKVNMTRQLMIQEGYDIEKINKIHMPVGLDIGAQTPGEIAVSIAAEMIRVRRGGSANSLKDGRSQKATCENSCEIATATDREVLQKAIKAARDDTPAAIATIIKTSGSTPRKAGARMIIYKQGRTFGTIGGGSGESEVSLAALSVIDEELPRLYKVSLNADTAASDGMICGGMMEVFIEPVSTFGQAFNGGGIIESK